VPGSVQIHSQRQFLSQSDDSLKGHEEEGHACGPWGDRIERNSHMVGESETSPVTVCEILLLLKPDGAKF